MSLASHSNSNEPAELGLWLEALASIGAIINAGEAFEVTLQQVCQAVLRLFESHGTHLLVCDWEREEMELRVSVGLVETLAGTRYPMFESLAGYIVLERQAKAFTWEEATRMLHPSVRDRIQPQHLAVVPLIHKDHAVGCLLTTRLVGSPPFTLLELAVLKAIGPQVALALGVAPIQAHLDESERTIRLLSDTSRAVNSQLDLDSVLRNTLNRILFALGAEIGSIMLLDEERRNLVIRWSRGIPDNLLSIRFRVGEGIAGYVALTGESVFLEEGQKDPRFVRVDNQVGVFSMIAVPLKSRGQIFGVLNVDSFDPQRKFTRNDLKLVLALAETVGVAFENARLFDQVEQTRTFTQSTLDSVEDLIFTLDRHLVVTSVNAAWKRAKTDELPSIFRVLEVGTRFLETVEPAVRSHWESVCERLLGAADDTDRFQDEELVFDTPAGRRWMRVSVSPLTNPAQDVLGLTWVATNVTAQRKASALIAQQANLLQNVHDAIIEIDRAGKVVYWNDGAHQLFGYTAAEAMGRNAMEFYLDEQRADGPRHIQEVIAGRVITGDFQARRRDGQAIWINMRAERVVDSDGQVTGLLNLARDITAQVRTAAELQAAQEKLRQLELHQALGKMADGVAHNFSNLLMVILGNTQLLMSLQNEPQVYKRLESIERAVLEGSALVRRIQNFTQARKNAPAEALLLPEILEQTIHFTEARWKDAAQSSGTRISLLKELGPVPPVLGNAGELREVCVNLIFNAVEALPAKGGHIMCRTFSEEDSVCLQIVDSGPGIPEAVKPHIFEPFFTTKGVTKTGLGLSAAQGIIKHHQGSITVESAPGAGTTVTVRFPIHQIAAAPVVTPARPVAQSVGTRPLSGRILVVDDEPEVATVLAAHLKQAGYTPVVACSGARGIEIFQEGPCDLVITDLGMPGLSGWDVVRLVKSLTPLVPTVILTGWGNKVEFDRAREQGVDVVLEKPITQSQLIETVEQLVGPK